MNIRASHESVITRNLVMSSHTPVADRSVESTLKSTPSPQGASYQKEVYVHSPRDLTPLFSDGRSHKFAEMRELVEV